MVTTSSSSVLVKLRFYPLAVFLQGQPRRPSIPLCTHQSPVNPVYSSRSTLRPTRAHALRTVCGRRAVVSSEEELGRFLEILLHLKEFGKRMLLLVFCDVQGLGERLVNDSREILGCDEGIGLVIERDERFHPLVMGRLQFRLGRNTASACKCQRVTWQRFVECWEHGEYTIRCFVSEPINIRDHWSVLRKLDSCHSE